jgi:hypothetical protein
VGMHTAPPSTISSEQTVAKTGLRMKKLTMKNPVIPDKILFSREQLATSNWQLAISKIFCRNESKDRKRGFIFRSLFLLCALRVLCGESVGLIANC